jgi:hypothetical protein
MPLYPYRATFLKSTLSSLTPAVNVPVYIYLHNTGDYYNVYEDQSGNSAYSMPLFTNEDGEVFFYAPTGQFRLEAQIDAFTTKTLEAVLTPIENLPNYHVDSFTTTNGTATDFSITTIPAYSVVGAKYYVVCRCTAGPSIGASAFFELPATIVDGSLVSSTLATVNYTGNPSWDIAAKTIDGQIGITLTGTASDTIIWNVTLYTFGV